MIIFVYDKTFEGLLTAVFDAYSRASSMNWMQTASPSITVRITDRYFRDICLPTLDSGILSVACFHLLI